MFSGRTNPIPELQKRAKTDYKIIASPAVDRRDSEIRRQWKDERLWSCGSYNLEYPLVTLDFWRALGSGKHWFGYLELEYGMEFQEFSFSAGIFSGRSWGQAENAAFRYRYPKGARRGKAYGTTGSGNLQFLRWCMQRIGETLEWMQENQDTVRDFYSIEGPIKVVITGTDDQRDRAYEYLKRKGFRKSGSSMVWVSEG
jgi:hypothetical protein